MNKRKVLLEEEDIVILKKIVQDCDKLEGDMAEVGVFEGGSAKIISENSDKTLHLFDTFEGLPELGEYDDAKQFEKGMYTSTEKRVKEYVKDAIIYKGIFPETAVEGIFSFVHIDPDLFEPTLAALEWFYPRTTGVILIHDCFSSSGVNRAINQFKPRFFIGITTMYGAIFKSERLLEKYEKLSTNNRIT